MTYISENLLQIGEVVLLTPKQPQVPQIADKITAMMEDAGLEQGYGK
ncbi:hypothetical protein [Anabaena sp. UHCC 0253]|nr:hypothetical protein [Anabaena sp. UHCC 0253]